MFAGGEQARKRSETVRARVRTRVPRRRMDTLGDRNQRYQVWLQVCSPLLWVMGSQRGPFAAKAGAWVRGPGHGPDEEGRVARGEKNVLFVAAAALRFAIVLWERGEREHGPAIQHTSTTFCLPFFPHTQISDYKNHYQLSNQLEIVFRVHYNPDSTSTRPTRRTPLLRTGVSASAASAARPENKLMAS